MSDESWKLQLSIKIDGVHLMNLRADTGAELSELIAWSEEHKEPLLMACAALAGAQKPQPAAPAQTQRQAPNVPQNGPGREIGPLVLENVEIKRAGRDGTVWKSPMFVLKWEGGASASTFDALNGKAAQGAWMSGSPCFLTLEPSPKNPRYMNLVSFRMAAAS